MTDAKPLDFVKIDALRRHMLLTHTQMSQLLGVSRVTYYNWKRGSQPSQQNVGKARAALKEMMRVMVEQQWPSPEVVAMDTTERVIALQRLMQIR